MSTKVRYEYVVTGVAEDGYPIQETADSRRKARFLKNEFKEFYGSTETKITQRKFKLEEVKVVR